MRLACAVVCSCALLLPALAHAEPVPGSSGATDAALAVAADGTPRVAYVTPAGSLVLARRDAAGTWTTSTAPKLPGAHGVVAALAGETALVEDADGRWLALAQHATAWRVRTVVRAPANAQLGFGGLALDRGGRPLVAYALRYASKKTYLRLVHQDARGRLVGERVTRAGFPPSDVLPAAAPLVLGDGSVRVVEVYDKGAIEWARTRDRKDWIGQYLYGSALGSPAGIVAAAASPGATWSAWTELFPAQGESQVLLTLHHDGERTVVLHHHAFLVSLALPPAGPEIGGDDYVELPGGRTVTAGVVADTRGAGAELAGDLHGYAVDAAGGRQYLLSGTDGGLDWYRTDGPPSAAVSLTSATAGASFVLSGRVDGAAAGASVELWRETDSGSELAATVPLAADGSFAYTDTPPTRPLLYRAVWRDPASGLPYASLLRSVLGG